MLAEKTSLSSQYFYDLQKFIVIERGLALLPVTSPTEAGKILAQMVNPLLLKTFWRFCSSVFNLQLKVQNYWESSIQINVCWDQCVHNGTTLQRLLFCFFEGFPCSGSLGFLCQWYQNSSFNSLLCLVLWKYCFSPVNVMSTIIFMFFENFLVIFFTFLLTKQVVSRCFWRVSPKTTLIGSR